MIDEEDNSTGEHPHGEPNVSDTLISSRNRNLLIIVGTAVLLVVIALFLWPRHESANKKGNGVEGKAAEEDANAGNEVVLSPTALAAAGIEIVGVTERPAAGLLRLTGAVEPQPAGNTAGDAAYTRSRSSRERRAWRPRARRRDACHHLKP